MAYRNFSRNNNHFWVIVEATGTDDVDDIDDMAQPVSESPSTSSINLETDYIIA